MKYLHCKFSRINWEIFVLSGFLYYGEKIQTKYSFFTKRDDLSIYRFSALYFLCAEMKKGLTKVFFAIFHIDTWWIRIWQQQLVFCINLRKNLLNFHFVLSIKFKYSRLCKSTFPFRHAIQFPNTQNITCSESHVWDFTQYCVFYTLWTEQTDYLWFIIAIYNVGGGIIGGWVWKNESTQIKTVKQKRGKKNRFFLFRFLRQKKTVEKSTFYLYSTKTDNSKCIMWKLRVYPLFFLRAFLFICFDFLWIKLYWFGHLIDSVNRFSYRFVWKINEGHVKSHVLTFNYYGLFICICQLTCSLSWSFSLKCQGLLEPNTTILFWERRKGERGLLLDRGKRK